MAAEAGAEHGYMVNPQDRAPYIRCVAALAGIRRLYMPGVLAGGGSSVMTGHAVTGYRAVIERSRSPGNRVVAVLAGIATGNVVR